MFERVFQQSAASSFMACPADAEHTRRRAYAPARVARMLLVLAHLPRAATFFETRGAAAFDVGSYSKSE